MSEFKIVSSYQPSGDQPKAILELVEGIERGDKHQTLLGVTGSGKTFTISNVIKQVKKPTLVISPNKTLAAQLYAEFKQFFPENNVEYFISYYDYYQPEAYLPGKDLYIEKDFAVNDEIDRLRLKATSSLVDDNRDIILVASVSCIYGIGQKSDFKQMLFPVKVGMKITRQQLLYKLAELHYSRNDAEFQRGTFRVRGDSIDLIPASETKEGIRITLFDNEVEKVSYIDVLTGKVLASEKATTIYPAKLFVTTENQLTIGMQKIKDELYDRVKVLRKDDKFVEAQRLEQRTMFDLEMMKEVGYCSGIENYSMHMSGRDFGDRPTCIFDYFPEDFLLVIDESHITLPQLKAMYRGDRMRKANLVEHGFRLPSAMENRPLKFEEFESMVNQVVYISATPSDYEMEKTEGIFVEQVIRPTGLLDPELSVRPVRTQIDDLINEIRIRVEKSERVLVLTLTKRMSEDLSDYLSKLNIKVAYIHSDLDSFARVDVIRKFRLGDFDVLVGINLLREGLDMPEVSLVAILDADKEGFLRSERALLQMAGRAARNAGGLVILYADRITRSMQVLIDETARRRKIQIEYNKENGLVPVTLFKSREEILSSTSIADVSSQKVEREIYREEVRAKRADPSLKLMTEEQQKMLLDELFMQMKGASKNLDFELASQLRDEIQKLSKEFKMDYLKS
jgi:excinuclease ABC subunit B